MLGLIWALRLMLLTAQAQDLMSSTVQPKELLKPELQSEYDKSYVQSMLKRYSKNSKYVIIGEVLDVREVDNTSRKDKEADILVKYSFRGETAKVVTIFVPYISPFVEGDYSSVPGKVIRGYDVIAFLDQKNRVVEGNAIFYTDGDYLWRNKRPKVFLQPSFDREWYIQNPYDDYVIASIEDVKRWLVEQKMGSWLR